MARVLITLLSFAALGLTATPASAANSTAGGTYFRAHCSVCHGSTANAPQGIGPRLFGVVGRHAGTLPKYNFSPAMRQSGITWSAEQLKRYLTNPQAAVRGNKMPFSGIPKATDVDDLVAYLTTLR
jgi:cytochrome c